MTAEASAAAAVGAAAEMTAASIMRAATSRAGVATATATMSAATTSTVAASGQCQAIAAERNSTRQHHRRQGSHRHSILHGMFHGITRLFIGAVEVSTALVIAG
jgi:hypothetical protein